MQLRKACLTVVKPICAAAIVGAVVFLLQIAIPRGYLGGNPLATTLLLFLGFVCVSLRSLDACRPNAVLDHGAIGLLAGFVVGFILNEHDIARLQANGVGIVDWQNVWMGAMILALLGSLAGIFVGTVRRAAAGRFACTAKWCDIEPIAKEFGALPSRVSASRRLIQFGVFGAGLVVIYPLVAGNPPVPVIDSRGLAETLELGAKVDARSPAPIRSMGRPTPRMVDAAAAKELILNKGNRIRDLRFSADGRELRTVDDGAVCYWGASDLAFLRNVSIPAGYAVGSIRPSDGRFALCYDTRDPTRPVQVIDLENGKPICQARLPFAWNGPVGVSSLAHAGNVYWLGDSELQCTERNLGRHSGASEDWYRLNYQIEIGITHHDPILIPVQEVEQDLELKNGDLRDAAEVTEDGKYLFVIRGGGKSGPPDTVEQIDLQTFQTAELGRIDRSVNGPFGLVPGGKYFHLGLYVYDRRSLNLIAAKDFTGHPVTISAVTFSPDGSRYAASMWLGHSESPTAVLVYEPHSSRIVTAFTSSSGVDRLRFSQDATQLAIAYEDGALELRVLPSGQPARPVLP
ncbi:MAG: hypothetical protein P4L84_16835 [Isosphaeraceae bacterium]|nr:hypothetical protein [Isosphaeraceae bacterium]